MFPWLAARLLRDTHHDAMVSAWGHCIREMKLSHCIPSVKLQAAHEHAMPG